MMRKAVLIGILAVLAGAGPARTAGPAMPVLVAEVEAALDKGDAGQAAHLADTALKETGVSAAERGRLLLYRGLAQELLGAHDAAVTDFTRALATNALPPDARAQALLQRGFLRDGQGKLDQASADYSAVIAMKGDGHATALNNRANIFRRQNRLMEARRDYLAALAAGGGKPQYSYYGLGQIAEAQADTLMARNAYAKALAADPDYSLASERLAALGGVPEGTIADADRLTLRPPPPATRPPAPAALAADAARGFKVATEAAREPDGTIVLRSPPARDGGDQIVLRPPPARPVAERPAPMRPAPSPPPVRTVGGLVLRPALDQREAPSMKSVAAGQEVQLGAWRSQAEADAGWDKAKARAPELLARLGSRVVMVDLPGKGRYFRLRVSPAPGQSQAGLCDSLMAQGMACLPARD